MLTWDRAGDWVSQGPIGLCSFGITEAIAAIGATFASAGAATAGAIGLGDATLAGISAGTLIGGGLEGATIGALGGGALAGIEGKPILTGALEGGAGGALTGGLTAGVGGGLAGQAGSGLGIGATAGDIAAGAGVGALGAGAFGGNPLTGALTGGGLEGASLAASGLTAPTGTAAGTVSGGPGAGAGAISAPPGSDIYAGGAGSGTGDAVLNSGAGLAGPETSGLQSAVTGYSAPSTLDSTTLAGATGAGTELSPGAASDLNSQLSLSQQGGTNNVGFVQSTTNPGAPNLQEITGLGSPTTPATTSSPGAVANPELGGATGFSPGGASESAPSTGVLGGLLGDNVTGGAASSALGITPSGAGTGNSIGNLLSDPSLAHLGTALSSNANLLLPGALLGYEALRGNQTLPGQNAISAEATQLGQQSQQLQSYLNSGTLPPGISTALKQASTQAEATIRSQYASRGMSGSSAEAADLANVQNTIVSQGASIAQGLLQTGVQEAGLAANLYSSIMQTALQQDTQLGSAITSLASASVSPRITLSGATASG